MTKPPLKWSWRSFKKKKKKKKKKKNRLKKKKAMKKIGMMIALVAENVEVPEAEEAISLETENVEVFDDGQGPISEPEAEEGDHHGEVASSRAIDPSSTSITEEEFVSEEHDWG